MEEQKLLALDGPKNNYFGYSVSISGDAALVGAMYDNDNGSYSGSAYVYNLEVLQVVDMSPILMLLRD